jgi:hypothetical protein
MRLQVVSPGFHIPDGAFVDAPHLLTPEEEQAVRDAPNAETLLARTMRVSDEAAGNIEHAGPAKKLPAADGGDHGHDVAAASPQAAGAADPPSGSSASTTSGGASQSGGSAATPPPAGPSASLDGGGKGGTAKSL